MRVSVLKARVSLSKTYRIDSKEPYPNAYLFKSSTQDISTIEQLYALIKAASLEGACLLKGELDKDLDWESRAGHTDGHKATSWVCFDVDYIGSISSIDDFLQKIGETETSYVLQWSASYGIHGNFFIRAHLFFLLDQPQVPEILKLWLKQINFQVFPADLALNKNNKLRWGLDITTCQSDKLLFVAAPTCHPSSINQFQGERIVLVKKSKDRLTLPTNLLPPERIKVLEEAKINELLKAAGLEPRTTAQFKLKEFHGTEYLPNPGKAIVTGVKEDGDWVRLNLNGGDSWAYYHRKDKPEFIHNFKGEHAYKTKELVPEYWYALQAARAQATKAASKGKLLLAFCEYRTGAYFKGTYDEMTEVVDIAPARSEKQLGDFLAQHGQPVPEIIPTWDVVYDPLAGPIDLQVKRINTFVPSRYMKEALTRAEHKPFPNIDRLCRHVMGDGCINRWYNWLAFIFQFRVAPGTAWVWHGVQGIGKGLIYTHVLTPLLGLNNVTSLRMEQLEDKFNGHLENRLICFIDEAQVSDSGRNKMIMANLKNQITEPIISVRNMHMQAYSVVNHVGWIFASNMPDAVVVAPEDRRFNVGEFQRHPISDTDTLVKAIETELLDFAVFLRHYQVDAQLVREPVKNAARENLIAISRDSAEIIAGAILAGDCGKLWSELPSEAPRPGSMRGHEEDAYFAYKKLIYDVIKEGRDRLTREDLYTIFNFCVGNVTSSPGKLASYLRHKGIEMTCIRVGNKTPRGVMVDWKDGPTWFAERRAEILQEEQPQLKVVPKTETK